MAKVSASPPLLGPLHHVYVSPPDPILTQVIIFYLPYSGTSSRVDAHVYSGCGFASYPRMTIDPSSNLYSAVNNLPLPQKESESYRALAFILHKYFSELALNVKSHCLATAGLMNATMVPFDSYHAGDLAARLYKVESETLIPNLVASMRERYANCLDMDLVLPTDFAQSSEGHQARLLNIFGEPTDISHIRVKRQNSRSARTRAKSVIIPTPNPEVVDQQAIELLNTEISYVDKLHGFMEDFVRPERARSAARPDREPSLATLDELFPRCLDKILELNSAFLLELEPCVGNGVDTIAEVCLKHFPGFKNAYSEYIRLNPAFSGLLPKIMKSRSTFAKRVENTGEQRLRSILIEPVQRLPRYSLLIDVMINNLTLDSPAVAKLNTCRTTISEICELQEAPSAERSNTATRLSSMVGTWPSSLRPSGRIIAAVDFLDLVHPFADSCEQISSIMLLFPDCVVFLRRLKSTSLKAQGIVAEIDRPSSMVGSASKREAPDLQFAGWTNLSDVRFSESDKGRAVWPIFEKDLQDFSDTRMGVLGVRKFWLCNAWEGKATELLEDILKTRLEVKASNATQLRSKARSTGMHGVDLWTAEYKNQLYKTEQNKSRILVRLNDRTADFGDDESVEILVLVTVSDFSKIRAEIRGRDKTYFVDNVNESDFLTVLIKRLSVVLEKQSHPSHPPLTAALVETNRRVIKSLQLMVSESESRFKTFRPPSPVKLLSNLILGNSPTPTKTPLPKERSIMDNVPVLSPPRILERAHSVVYRSEAAEEDIESRLQRITIVEGWGGEEETYHRRLERSLEAFIIGLENAIVSNHFDIAAVKNRRSTDDNEVTKLVNSLLKEPNKHAPALAAPINVLLLGLEKFFKTAWQDSMGNLLSSTKLKDMIVKYGSLYAGDFDDYFKTVLSEMTPQNKRALKTIITLLAGFSKANMPEGRESLIAAFAELLVKCSQQRGSKDRPDRVAEFAPLLEQLVAEKHKIFEDSIPIQSLHDPGNEASASLRRSRTVATSTIGSSSSIKRRFGLPSSNDSSAPNSITRATAASVWRNLSKKGEKDRPISPPKTPTLSRSKSIDQGMSSSPGKRPMSRDRPTINGLGGTPLPSKLVGGPDTPALPPIVGSPAPSTPGASSMTNTPQNFRKKRRSSLSDIIGHQNSPKPLFESSLPSPARNTKPLTPRGLDRKENKPLTPSTLPIPVARDQGLQKLGSRIDRHRSRDDSLLSTRDIIAPLNIVKDENKEVKFKVQSSQKLTERLNNEKKQISATENVLKDELSKIGEELAQIRIGPRGTKSHTSGGTTTTTSATTLSTNNNDEIRRLSSRITKFENQTTSTLSDLNRKYDALNSTFQTTMAKREQEVKGLDKLYQDVNEENDVLFERFNDELGKVATAMRCGDAEKELLRLLTKTREQEGLMRAENARLKRENLSLKSSVLP